MRIISCSIFLSLFVVAGIQGMGGVKGAATAVGGFGGGTLAGIGAGAAVGGPVGAVIGGVVGFVAGGTAGTMAGENVAERHEKREQARNERAAQEAAKAEEEQRLRNDPSRIYWDRVTKALSLAVEYNSFPVNESEKADFVKYENGTGPLVVARRAFADLQPQEVEALVTRVNQRLLLLRQRYGRPVDGYTGNFVELNARRNAGQTAIDNPAVEQIRLCKTAIDNAEFNDFFQDIEKLFVVGKLFWKQSNKPTETLKTVMAHIRWATLNAYALPLMELVDNERQLKQRAEGERDQERQTLVVRTQERDAAIGERDAARRERNAAQEELARRRAQSPERRAQIEAQAAEIARLRRDLAASRDAFASCRLTNQ